MKNYVKICIIINKHKKKGVFMVNKEEIRAYKIPGLKTLDEKQLGFFVDIQNGMSVIESYVKNFKNGQPGNASYETLNGMAYEKTRTKWYKEYKKFYDDVKQHESIVNTTWTLEMSISERKKLYELNKLEVDRLAKAYDMEIEYYTRKKQEAILAGDDDTIEKYENKIIRAAKSKNMAVASNTACTQALEGLDKLKGLQTVNINHKGNINFFGDDMWGDDDSTETNA